MNSHTQWQLTLTWPCQTAPTISFSSLWSWRRTQSRSGPAYEWGRIRRTTATEEEKQTFLGGKIKQWHINKPWAWVRDKWKQKGAGAKGDRMQGDRWRQRDAKWKRDASGRANTKTEGMEGGRTDRHRHKHNREQEEESEVVVPYNCWAADIMHIHQ